MLGAHESVGDTRSQVSDALGAAGRTDGPVESRPRGAQGVLALQRMAGNAAVSALMSARLRAPGQQATAEIDAGLREIRSDDPVVDTVEKGLKAATGAGVPVDLEGTRPPASALAVVTTGFGPASVAPTNAV